MFLLSSVHFRASMVIVHIALFVQFFWVSKGFILQQEDTDRNVVNRLLVSNGAQWGDWRQAEFCPNGSYAKGFNIKVENPQGDGDDTALNGIRLDCYSRSPSDGGSAMQSVYTTTYYYYTTTSYGLSQGPIRSGEGPWGSYQYYSGQTCHGQDDFLTSFSLKVEPNQNFGDDTAVNDVKFRCRNFEGGNQYELAAYSPTQWGFWGTYSLQCPDGSAICGLSTKIESSQNVGAIDVDDTALNDVIFYCCT